MTGLNMESFLRLLRADLGAWASLGAIAIVLALMTWTSWGSRRALWKCLVLSVVVHVGVLLYGGVLALLLNLMRVDRPGGTRPDEVVERVRIAPVVDDEGPGRPGAGGRKGRAIEAWDRDRGPLALADPALMPPRPEPPPAPAPLEAPKVPEPLEAEPVVAQAEAPAPPRPEPAPEMRPEAPDVPPDVAASDPTEVASAVAERLGAPALEGPDPAPRLRPDLGPDAPPRGPSMRATPPEAAPAPPDAPVVALPSTDRGTPARSNPAPASPSAPVAPAEGRADEVAAPRVMGDPATVVTPGLAGSDDLRARTPRPDAPASRPPLRAGLPPAPAPAPGPIAEPSATPAPRVDPKPSPEVASRPSPAVPPAPPLTTGPDLELPDSATDEPGPEAPRIATAAPTPSPSTTLPDADIRRSIRPTREGPAGSSIVPPQRLQDGATPIAMARVTPAGPSASSTLPRPSGRRSLADVPAVYRSRLDPNRTALAQRSGASVASEQAVERALDWLARHQDADGRWDGGTAKYRDGGAVPDDDSFTVHCPPGDVCFGECYYWEADTALTGLSLLAYLGAGYTHMDGKYAQTVTRGLSFLLKSQKADGDLRGPSVAVGMYCHAMATLALAEAYALTGDARLRPAVEKGIGFLVRSRARDGLAWRYVPDEAPSGDTSILGWVVMAMKTGKLVGVAIPPTIQAGTQTWLKKVSAGTGGGLARYRPSEKVKPSMTAEAWACRQFLGFGGPGPESDEAAAYLLKNGPASGPYDIYYWYYGTLAMFQRGGADWTAWNAQVRDQVVRRQHLQGHKAGSWDPDDSPYGTHGGRIYGTALATLTLEVYYRFLRLQDSTPIAPDPAPARPVDGGARRAGGGSAMAPGR